MKAEVEILHPGLFSTIQDFGRRGFQKYGVPLSGVMDRIALKTANLILQNQADAAVMEITQMGPKLKFSAATKIAISGAHLSPKLNDTEIENNEVVKIHEGDILSFGRPEYGMRSYLAILDGFKTEKVLGSRSWYEDITRHEKLEKGMKLQYEASEEQKYETHAAIKFDEEYLNSEEIEVFPGPEFEKLPETLKSHLRQSKFSIDKNNNRMAIQLSEILENEMEPIITGPVLPGTVQLTPGGKLIVLMRDCQTTGGYPRVLQLSEKGINMMAQKKAGDKIRFKSPPTPKEGEALS
jgi:biotin-dependent carboxylase-like uncharacterized protein